MNHENTKSKKHEMFRANFRVFVLSCFRDEKRTSNIQRPTSNDKNNRFRFSVLGLKYGSLLSAESDLKHNT